MNEILEPLAKTFGTDIQTMWKSIASGTSSTGLGIYLTNISGLDFQFQVNIVSLFWGALSCIVLTILSLLVSDCYKSIKKKIINKNKTIE